MIAEDTDCRAMMFIDADLNQIRDVARPYGLKAIPTILVLVDGKLVNKEVTTSPGRLLMIANEYSLPEDQWGDECDNGDSGDKNEDSQDPSCENKMLKP